MRRILSWAAALVVAVLVMALFWSPPPVAAQGGSPRTVVTHVQRAGPAPSALPVEIVPTMQWWYNAETNQCYPIGIGMAGWTPVDACPKGSDRGVVYEPTAGYCYPFEAGLFFGTDGQWRATCPTVQVVFAPGVDPATKDTMGLVGISTVDGLTLRDRGDPAALVMPCQAGAVVFASGGFYVCDGAGWSRVRTDPIE